MATTTVKALAEELKRSPADLLEQLKAARLPFIKEVLSTAYWQYVSVAKFEHLRTELRMIVRFIEKEFGKTYFSDFADHILQDPGAPVPVVNVSGLTAYKRRVTEFIQKNRYHITILTWPN